MGWTLFSVGGGEWGCMGYYFELVRVGGALFWIGGGGWEDIWLGGGGWGLVGVSGGELGWVHCLIMPFVKYLTLYLSGPASCDYSNFLKPSFWSK